MRQQTTYRFGPTLTPTVKTLLLVNVAVFFLTLFAKLLSPALYQFLFYQFALFPEAVLLRGKFWQLVTYAFLHAGIGHVFWNMVTLYMFGCELEGLLGRKRFLILYFLAAIFGGFAIVIAGGDVTLGASGATMGLVAAYGYAFANRPISLLFPPITLRAKWLSVIWVGLDFLYYIDGASVPGFNNQVAYLAHIGGALGGLLCILFFYRPNLQGFKLGQYSLRDHWKRFRARRYLRMVEKRERDEDEERGPTFH